jgi:glycosyltransferase involved in cell wall biosynthesis
MLTDRELVLPLPKGEFRNCRMCSAMRLSVIMPVYNEAATIGEAVAKVLSSGCADELIIVDDGSHDGTTQLLSELQRHSTVRCFRHSDNHGKGAALRTGFCEAKGDIVIIQDADLEYDPADYELLIQPILAGEADVVYGSRFLGSHLIRMPLLRRLANRLITRIFNFFFGQQLTDVETCYKAIRRDVLWRVLPLLSENRFGIEIELTARLARLPGIRIIERPISYSARSYFAGKKIRWRDGFRALWCILKYRYLG